MICKKCGANIADTSKFCENCGNAVENTSQVVNIEPNNIDDNKVVVESVEPFPISEQPAVEVPVMPEVAPVVPAVEPIATSEQPAVEPVQNNINQINNIQMPLPSQNQNNKKKNELIWIIIGLVAAIGIIGAVAFSLLFTSKNSILVLEKAYKNFQEKAKNSFTTVVSLDIGAGTGESMSLSANIKTEKKSDDKFDMQITVNESMFFDEMNAYASFTKDYVTMFFESSLVDMLGTTYSETPMWLYYKLMLDEIVTEENEEKVNNIKAEEIIDKEHFVYVDNVNGLNHYQLIIDQKLIDTLKTKLDDETINETVADMEELEQPIKIDFYINKSNELVKVELDMSEYMTEEDSLSKLLVRIEFKDLDNTSVIIPSDVINSGTQLETYMTTYSSFNFDYGYDDEIDYDVDYNSNFDNFSYGL